jgi:sugar phosphate isomerase/epimerase
MNHPPISVFPKCYFDELVAGRMDYVEWIRAAAALGGEGIEHYDEFFRSYDARDVDPVLAAMRDTGQVSSMLCFSPNFTHPDAGERARQIDRQKAAIDLSVRIGARYCRTLSGQRYPDVSRPDGIQRTVECILRSIDYAAKRDVVLTLENHYKVGDWKFPEFAQQPDVFLEILEQIPESPHFGVQYDPSNALVAGADPVAFLEQVKHRVVTMHASDRYLVPGTTFDEIRQADGTVGYPDKLRHGETGKGTNDYDAIFRILSEVHFTGWISVEDGMSGLDELARSVAFLKKKRAQYFPGPRASLM